MTEDQTSVEAVPQKVGLQLDDSIRKNEDDQSIQIEPENVRITIRAVGDEKNIDVTVKTVEVTIAFDLPNVSFVTDSDIEEKRKKGETINGFMGFKESKTNGRENEIYEIQTKKMPKLSLNTKESEEDIIKLLFLPTIENNDTTVKVSSRFFVKGYLSKNVNEFPRGLKLSIAQKVLGNFIIGGIDAEKFTVSVELKKGSYNKNSAHIIIKFLIDNVELNKEEKQSLEWASLLTNEYMAYVIFEEMEYLNDSFLIRPIHESGQYPYQIKVDFSFNIADSERNRFAPKVPPHSSKVPPHSFKVPPHSGVVFP